MVKTVSKIQQLKDLIAPLVTLERLKKLLDLGTTFFRIEYCLANGVFLRFDGSGNNFETINVYLIIYHNSNEYSYHYGTYSFELFGYKYNEYNLVIDNEILDAITLDY